MSNKYAISADNPLQQVYYELARLGKENMRLARDNEALRKGLIDAFGKIQEFQVQVIEKHNNLTNACKGIDEWIKGMHPTIQKTLNLAEKTLKVQQRMDNDIQILMNDGKDTDHELKYLRARADINMNEIYKVKDIIDKLQKQVSLK